MRKRQLKKRVNAKSRNPRGIVRLTWSDNGRGQNVDGVVVAVMAAGDVLLTRGEPVIQHHLYRTDDAR